MVETREIDVLLERNGEIEREKWTGIGNKLERDGLFVVLRCHWKKGCFNRRRKPREGSG